MTMRDDDDDIIIIAAATLLYAITNSYIHMSYYAIIILLCHYYADAITLCHAGGEKSATLELFSLLIRHITLMGDILLCCC